MPTIWLGGTVFVTHKEFEYNIPIGIASSFLPTIGYVAAAFVPNKNDGLAILVSPCGMPSEPLL
jgi:hypothetical protein